VSGHAAIPDFQNAPERETGIAYGREIPEEWGALGGEGDREVIEEHKAEAAAEEDAEDAAVEDEVRDAFRMKAKHAVTVEFFEEEVRHEETHEVGQAIPARAERADFEDVGVEVVDVVGDGGDEHEGLGENWENGSGSAEKYYFFEAGAGGDLERVWGGEEGASG
jgi:hypothetical protein